MVVWLYGCMVCRAYGWVAHACPFNASFFSLSLLNIFFKEEREEEMNRHAWVVQPYTLHAIHAIHAIHLNYPTPDIKIKA